MSRKKLSKAEYKQLFICRERVYDVLLRCRNVADTIEKKGWPEAQLINDAMHVVNNLHKKLEELETIQYKLEHEI